MRNLLQEFLIKHDDVRYPTILGLREHIFTGRYFYSRDEYYGFICFIFLKFMLLIKYFPDNVVSHLLHGSCQIKSIVLLLLGRGCWLTL